MKKLYGVIVFCGIIEISMLITKDEICYYNEGEKMNKRKKINLIMIILLISVFIYFVSTFAQQQKQIYALSIQEKEFLDRIEKEKQTEAELKLKLELTSENQYVESIAREKLGMVKDGERIFVDINK